MVGSSVANITFFAKVKFYPMNFFAASQVRWSLQINFARSCSTRSFHARTKLATFAPAADARFLKLLQRLQQQFQQFCCCGNKLMFIIFFPLFLKTACFCKRIPYSSHFHNCSQPLWSLSSSAMIRHSLFIQHKVFTSQKFKFTLHRLVYLRGGQIAARGPNVDRHSVFSGPQKHSRNSSNLPFHPTSHSKY